MTKSLAFPPLSIVRDSFIQLSQLGRQWRERKCPIFKTETNGDSNPGSLDCESGILPLSYRAPGKGRQDEEAPQRSGWISSLPAMPSNQIRTQWRRWWWKTTPTAVSVKRWMMGNDMTGNSKIWTALRETQIIDIHLPPTETFCLWTIVTKEGTS